MKKVTKISIIIFCVFIFLLSIFYPVYSGKRNIDLKFNKGETLSVKLNGTPLRVILKRFEQETGIWFKGDPLLFEEEISLQFMGLSYEDSLKRILISRNYSFIFDQNMKLEGVFVFAKSNNARKVQKRQRISSKRSYSAKPNKKNNYGNTFKVTHNSPPPGISQEIPIDMKIVKKCPPPENSNPDPIDLIITKNCPPPENSEAEPIDMTIAKNCPAP